MSTKNRPMMEELKKGRWPSFITEIEKSEGNEMSHELLDLLEESYERKVPLWKHGGIVGVRGYGGGVVGRYTLEPEPPKSQPASDRSLKHGCKWSVVVPRNTASPVVPCILVKPEPCFSQMSHSVRMSSDV